MTKLRPLNDHIVVRRDSAPATGPGGKLVLPDRDEGSEPILTGVVLAVGPGKLNEADGTRFPMQCSVGDHIKFERWGWDEIIPNVGDDPVLVMTDNHAEFIFPEGGALDAKPSKR